MAAYPLVSRTADSSKHLGSSIGQAEVKDPNLAIDSDDSQETVGASTHTAATPKSANSKRVRSKPSSRKAAQEIPWRKQLGPIKKERLPESWFNIQEHSSKTPLLHFGVRIPGVDDYLERLHRRLRPDLNKNDVELVHAVYLAATLKLIKLLKEKSLPSPEMPVIAMTPHKFDFFVSLYNNMRVYRFFRATIDEHIPEYLQCIKEAWLLNDDELEQPMWYHDAINCDEDALPTDEERKAFVADFPKDLYTDPDQPTSSKATLAGGAATSATQAP